jgi:ubiquitin-protein ligase
MNPRLRRLYADSEQIDADFTGHPNIQVVPLEGNPPEKYRITYRLPGLRLDPASNRPVVINEHRAQIYLHQGYPREKPKCVMETESFHPNIGSYICIDDYWAAGMTLSDIIIQIGEMIQYRNFNPRSPLNAIAAAWSVQNEARLPIGHMDLYQPELDIDFFELEETPSEPAKAPEPAVATTPAPVPAEDDLDIELQ